MVLQAKDRERMDALEETVRELTAQLQGARLEDNKEHGEMREAIAALTSRVDSIGDVRGLLLRNAITIGLAVLLQAAAGVWWAANISNDVQHLSKSWADLSTQVRDIDRTRFPANEEQNYRREVQRVIERMEDRLINLEKHK